MVLILVALHVQGQMIRAREAAAAGQALEGFGAGVFPVVSGELIRSGEAPVAVLPCAAVRLLPCKTDEDGGVSDVQNDFTLVIFLLVRTERQLLGAGSGRL